METKNISKASLGSKLLAYLSYKNESDYQKMLSDINSRFEPNKDEFDKFAMEFECKDFNFVTLIDADYPSHLKSKPMPPLVLYYRGDLELLSDSNYELRTAILGTSKPTNRALHQTHELALSLAKENKILVSDLSKGISTEAIKTFLDNNQKVIILLPCGLNNIYPIENKDLIDSVIAAGGLVITEFPDWSGASMLSLARKNVILGLLAKEYTFIQMKRNKGSLAVAISSALQNGASINAVPDTEDSENACNDLIVEGAFPLFGLAYVK